MLTLKDLEDLVMENKYTCIVALSLFLGAVFCFLTTRSCRTVSKKKEDIKSDINKALERNKKRKRKQA